MRRAKTLEYRAKKILNMENKNKKSLDNQRSHSQIKCKSKLF